MQSSVEPASLGKQAKFPIVEMWRVVGGKVVWLRPVYGDYDQVRDALALS